MRRKSIIFKVLSTVGKTGVLVVAAQSPYFWTNLMKAYFCDPEYTKKQIRCALTSLFHEKDILVERSNGLVKVKLSNQGKRKLVKLHFWELKIERPKKWDKKWRIVIFDISNEKNKQRETFRLKLRNLGFYQIQKSVWVYPYECKEEISLIRKYLGIEPFVKFIVTRELETDKKLLDYFKLSIRT